MRRTCDRLEASSEVAQDVGPFDTELFKQVAEVGGTEAEILNFRLVEKDGVPYQRIEREHAQHETEVVDFSTEPDPVKAARASARRYPQCSPARRSLDGLRRSLARNLQFHCR